MTAETEKQTDTSLTEVVKTLVAVIEEKDEYLKGHSERVATNCFRFSKKLDIPQGEIEKIYLSALLHDIGIVYIPLEIIQKAGKLTEDEMIIVKQHPIISEKILSKHNMFKEILPIVRHHHEDFDGSGYPDGLKGDEIPIGARILCVMNSYDAMVSARPHRPSFSTEEALEEIEKNAGRQFDEKLINVFLEFIKSDESIYEKTEVKEEKQTVKDIILEVVERFKRGQIDLPVLPKVIQEIESVMNQPTSTVDDLAKVIERDGVISVRLISVVNSPLYRGTEKIYNVRQAIPRLGIKETQSIVMAIANKSLYKTKRDQFRMLMEKLWLHSLVSAYCSRSIAEELRFEDLEKFFLMGLIHDIGKAPLLKMLTESVSKEEPFDIDDIIKGIQEVHTSFGGVLLKRWRFPQDFIRVATRHEGPKFSQTIEKTILVVNLATNLANVIGYGITDNEIELAKLESAKILKFDSDILDEIGEETKKVMKETAHIF